jgi:hypothetical protein
MKNSWLWAVAVIFVLAPSLVKADSIQVQSTGATTVTVGGSGTTMYSNSNFNGWDVVISAGSSNSPGLSPFGIDLTVLATCSGSGTCAANPLNIFYSDINFNVPVAAGAFSTTYSATLGGGATTSELGWANNLNTLFALGGTNKVGPVGPFSGSGGFSTVTGGPAETGLYSLTLEDIFTAPSGTASSFSADASLTGTPVSTPEPSSLVLLGSALLALMLVKRRWEVMEN